MPGWLLASCIAKLPSLLAPNELWCWALWDKVLSHCYLRPCAFRSQLGELALWRVSLLLKVIITLWWLVVVIHRSPWEYIILNPSQEKSPSHHQILNACGCPGPPNKKEMWWGQVRGERDSSLYPWSLMCLCLIFKGFRKHMATKTHT